MVGLGDSHPMISPAVGTGLIPVFDR